MQCNRLAIGQVYFSLAYEDDDFARPIIHSYVYVGAGIDEPSRTLAGNLYVFRFVGSDDRLELKEHQVSELILDVPGLAGELKQWSETQAAKKR